MSIGHQRVIRNDAHLDAKVINPDCLDRKEADVEVPVRFFVNSGILQSTGSPYYFWLVHLICDIDLNRCFQADHSLCR